MKTALLVLAVAGIAGCGAEPDPVVGTWRFDVAANDFIGVTFNDDDTYATQHFTVGGNAAFDEAESGTYVRSSSTITFTPRKSSCPGPVPAWSVGYVLSSASLAMDFGTTVISFVRQPTGDGGGSFVITFGCFAQDGTFTARAVTPVAN